VARDRKRAKQRRDRRGGPGARGGPQQSGRPHLTPSQPERADVPGALEHASSDVDEFDAALVRGADGVTAAPDADDATAAESDVEDGLAEPNGAAPEPAPAEAAASGNEMGLRLDDAIAQGSGGAAAMAGTVARPAAREQAPAAPRGVGRAIAFLEASWAELQRVQWPDRRQVVQATAVVLGFVIVAGVYLGVADLVAKEIVEFVL
jgi:preprotein translocase subunit SecE